MNGYRLKLIKKLMLLSLLIVTSASTIADDDKTADTKHSIETIIKFNAFYREKVNSEIDVCLKDTASYANKRYDEIEKSALDSTTKKQQEDILNNVNAWRKMLNISTEAGCFVRFYVQIENAYEGTFLTALDSKVMEEAINDPLTDNKMKEILNFYKLPHDKWLEKYVTGPIDKLQNDEDIKKAFNDPFKNVPTDFIKQERDAKYRAFVEAYIKVFASIPELGCVLEKEKMIYICGSKFESTKSTYEIKPQAPTSSQSALSKEEPTKKSSSEISESETAPSNIATNVAKPEASITPSETAWSPSFDCAKASTGPERLICSSKELSEADVQLNQAYKAAINKSTNVNELKNSQRTWRKTIRDACSNSDCMLNAYQMRINEIKIQ